MDRSNKAKAQAEEKRLNAVREAFWGFMPEDHADYSQLKDVLIVSNIVQAPTRGQVKLFFLLLPASILGQGIAWGFDDTEVRALVYEFVNAEKATVLETVLGIKDMENHG